MDGISLPALSSQRVCLRHSLPFPRQRGTTTWSILQPAGPVLIVCLPSALTFAYILYTQLHTRETIDLSHSFLSESIRHCPRISPAFPSFNTLPSATTIEPATSRRGFIGVERVADSIINCPVLLVLFPSPTYSDQRDLAHATLSSLRTHRVRVI